MGRSIARRVLALVAVGVGLACGGAAVMPDGRPTPSLQPVPRWISLKSSTVFARRGPDRDHRILWQYRARGLPVQVVAETAEWRLVCDVDGATAWVHRSVLSGRRAVFNPGSRELPVHAGRSIESGLKARLRPRSLVALKDCRDGWCRVRAGRLSGWVEADSVFGAAEGALCDANLPAGAHRAARGSRQARDRVG